MLGDLCVHTGRECSCTRMAAAAHEEGRQQGRAEYAELVAAVRAWVDGLGLVRGQSFTATEPVVRLLRAVRGLEAQTKPGEVRDVG